jgi:hypothetical protein
MMQAHRPHTLHRPVGLPAVHGAATAAARARAWLATRDGASTFHHWLGQHQDALFDWCLAHADGRLAPEDFTAAAMAVQCESGTAALTDWLLWAALMLARGQPPARLVAQPADGATTAAAPLPDLLLRLLVLSATQTLRTADVLDLLARDVESVHEALSQREAAWHARVA